MSDGFDRYPVMTTNASNSIRWGYARVSTDSQLDRMQLDALEAANCREIVTEKVSSRKDRPKLRRLLESMKGGDTLVIYKPDRIARSIKELLVMLEDEVHARDINLEILSGMCAGLHRPNGQIIADKMLFMVAAMAAELERDLLHERTLDGLAAARRAGKTGGRRPVIDDDMLAVALTRRAKGESVPSIANELKIKEGKHAGRSVSRAALYAALKVHDEQQPAAAEA